MTARMHVLPTPAPNGPDLRDANAEREVLAAVLTAHTAEEAKEILSLVPQSAWGFDRHRIFAAAMREIADRGHAVDVVLLHQVLGDAGQWEACGGMQGLGEILSRRGATYNTRAFAERVARISLERQILEAWTRGQVEAMQRDADGIAEAASRVAELSAELRAFDAPKVTWADKVRAMAARIENPAQRVVYSTGLASLDDRLDGGLSPGDVMVILAAPNTGKTVLAGQISAQMMRDGLPVIWFCETSEEKMLARWLAGESGVPTRAQKRGDLTDWQWGAANNGMDRMARWKCAVRPLMPVAQMEAEAMAFRREHGGLGAIVVDYVQLVDNGIENPVTNIERTTRALRMMASQERLDCVVIELSQPDKASAKSGELGMSSGKGASSIEADCDVLVIPLRDEADARRAGLRMAKVKDGERRDVPLGTLRFNGGRMAFEEAT